MMCSVHVHVHFICAEIETIEGKERYIMKIKIPYSDYLCSWHWRRWRARATVRSTILSSMAMRPSDCVNLAIDFQMLDLPALRRVSAASKAAHVHVLHSTNLRSLLQQKFEEEQAWKAFIFKQLAKLGCR